MAGLFPNYLMRQWTQDGKPLSGGLVYTYFSGTNTPKTVYQDAALTIPHANPVVLDASGHADIFMGNGAYRVWVKTAGGVQVAPPLDGIVGEGDSATGGAVYYSNYDALRANTTYPESVYVQGIVTPGDGGQGMFEKIPGSTEIDDSGIYLTANAGTVVYKRVFEAVLDPRWYGVVYGSSIDQYNALMKALQSSAAYNFPVQVAGSVYINQIVTLPTGASIHATLDGFFTSTLPVGIVFPSGTSFRGEGPTFGQGVSATFGRRTVQDVPLSWFADNSSDTRSDKWIASSVDSGIPIILDSNLSLTSSFVATQPFRQSNKATISFSANSITIYVPQILNGWQSQQIFAVPPTATTFAIGFDANLAYPEWFGGVGDNTVVSTQAVQLAAWSHRMGLGRNQTYKISTPASLPTDVSIEGAGVLHLTAASTFDTTTLTLQDCGIVLDNAHNWFTGDALYGTNATFPSTYTATNVSLDGCYYTDDTRNPVYAGAPALYNGHFPLLPSSSILGTDSVGKVISKASSPLVYGGAVWDLVARLTSTQTLMRVRHVNGRWFALGSGSFYAHSLDGINWNLNGLGNSAVTLQDIVWTGSNYVMVGYRTSDAMEQYSWRSAGSNPSSWYAPVTLPAYAPYPTSVIRCVGYNSGYLVAKQSNVHYVYSTNNGVTWTLAVLLAGVGVSNGKGFTGYVNGYWICADDHGNFYYTTNPAAVGAWSKNGSYDDTNDDYIVHVSYFDGLYHFVLRYGSPYTSASIPTSSPKDEVYDYSLGGAQVTDAFEMDGMRALSWSAGLAMNLNKVGWTARLGFGSSVFSSVGGGQGMFLACTKSGHIYRTF